MQSPLSHGELVFGSTGADTDDANSFAGDSFHPGGDAQDDDAGQDSADDDGNDSSGGADQSDTDPGDDDGGSSTTTTTGGTTQDDTDSAGDSADTTDDGGGDGGDDDVTPQRVRELAAGSDHACHLTNDGYASCWGFGPGTRVPRRDGFPGPIREIAAGLNWTCALMDLPPFDENGRGRQALGCWGSEERLHELQNTVADPYVEMDGNHGHLCLRRASGNIDCTPVGPFGDNDWFDFNPPYDGIYTRVSVGEDHACALTQAGKIYCWGSRRWEQLRSSPPPSGKFMAIASGSDYDCAVDELATLRCWTRFTDRHPVLSKLPDAMPRLRVVDTSRDQLCVVSVDGEALCWPEDFLLGDTPEGPFVDVVVGRDYACAKRLDWMPDTTTPSETVCWGAGFAGDVDD